MKYTNYLHLTKRPMACMWIVAKFVASATLVLLGVNKKGGCSTSPCPSWNLIDNHLVSRPLPGSTFVPTVPWIRNVFRTHVRWPLWFVKVRLKTGRPCTYKAINTKLPRYLALVSKVAMLWCCNIVRTWKVVLPCSPTHAWEIHEHNNIAPWRPDLTIASCTTLFYDLVLARVVVKAFDLMCAGPILCLIKMLLRFRCPWLIIALSCHCMCLSLNHATSL
jgi:hypothetical protein